MVDRVLEDAKDLAIQVASEDPEAGLRAVAALRRLLERLERIHVENARERGALASLGISLESVRGELEERFGDRVWTRSCLGVSPETKRVLELATRRRRTVTPEQVQLALLRHSPTVRRLLLDLGVPLGAL